MKSRAFNSIELKNQSIIKCSENKSKLEDEVNYYINLPAQIAHYFPALYTYKVDYSAYTLEYIPYENLANGILFNKINLSEGQMVLNKLLAIMEEMHSLKKNNEQYLDDIFNLYIKKTIERIEELRVNPLFAQLLEQEYLVINNKKYRNFILLEKDFIFYIKEHIATELVFTAIHGDFCFSNILYCPREKKIRLVDPRGSFGSKGIYGHSYYDYAKLMHCLHGKYDLIVNGKFQLDDNNNNNFIYHIDELPLLNQLYSFYLKQLTSKNMNIELIFLIEAALFLSMAALHYEDPIRQKAFYLNGIKILNEVFEGKYKDVYKSEYHLI